MRTCPNCGWEYPSTYTSQKCKFCGATFEYQICFECGELVPTSKLYLRSNGYYTRRCPDCLRKVYREWYRDNADLLRERRLMKTKNRLNKVTQELADWYNEIEDVPVKIMTEEEWLKTCDYFGGCAICGEPNIEVRQFFIPFEKGGKYTVFNMFPLCSDCVKKLPREIDNPFKWLDDYIGAAKKLGLTEERKTKLIEYLKTQAINIKEGN